MSSFYFYLFAGIVLIALELVTTTFYLLVIGIASVVAAVCAFFSGGWIVPTLSVGFLSVIGCFIVAGYRRKTNNNGIMMVSHLGQSVEVTEVNQYGLRVMYSGSHWNATTPRVAGIKVGDKLKIVKFSNSELEVE